MQSAALRAPEVHGKNLIGPDATGQMNPPELREAYSGKPITSGARPESDMGSEAAQSNLEQGAPDFSNRADPVDNILQLDRSVQPRNAAGDARGFFT